MSKKFKRYFTGAANSTGKSGKGSWQRDADVPDQQVSDNWCAAFGHRRLGDKCVTCGTPLTRQQERTQG